MPFSSVLGASSVIKPGVCTSTTKPSAPYDGQVIYMTDVDQTAVWDGSAWVGLDPSRDRNLVINGAMQVAQRGTSTTSITTSGYYTADRFAIGLSSLGTWTQTLENDAPTGSGFRKSIKLNCTTADASPAAGDYLIFYQVIERQNLQQIAKGTASAKQLTLSFWVKGTTTGTYIVELYDNENARAVSASYSISSANAWEKKTVTFPADTTGTFTNDNGAGFSLQWWLGAGTTYSSGTLATTWGTTTANRAVGGTNLAGATSRTWQITGVQLEVGAVATPFEFEDYQTTMVKCMRYFQVLPPSYGQANTSTQIVASHVFHVPMRTSPSVGSTGVLYVTDGYSADPLQSATSVSIVGGTRVSPQGAHVAYANYTGLTVGRMYCANFVNSNNVTFSAEL